MAKKKLWKLLKLSAAYKEYVKAEALYNQDGNWDVFMVALDALEDTKGFAEWKAKTEAGKVERLRELCMATPEQKALDDAESMEDYTHNQWSEAKSKLRSASSVARETPEYKAWCKAWMEAQND